jgi:hypothetical protein
MLKLIFRIGVILLAAGIISGGMVLLVQHGILTSQSVSALAGREGGGRQFDRAQGFTPPILGGAFRDRGSFNLQAGISGIVQNLLIIAGITMGVLVVRKVIASLSQIRRGKT